MAEPDFVAVDLGRVPYLEALELQRRLVSSRRADEHPDLLYYLCGVLVNLAADPDCSED